MTKLTPRIHPHSLLSKPAACPFGTSRAICRLWAWIALFGLLAGALFGSSVEATTVVPLALEERVRHAADILVATVVDAQSRWSGDAPRRIVTDYTLRIEQD